MEKWLLTSTGIANLTIKNEFLKMIDQEVSQVKVLYIPTAAIDEEAKAMLPSCRSGLLDAGVLEEHIVDYNLDKPIKDIESYDVIFVCGGNPQHLADCMLAAHFKEYLKVFFDKGGVYVGVSAGSMVISESVNNGFGLYKGKLWAHCDPGMATGDLELEKEKEIRLTNEQALVLIGKKATII